MKSLLIALVFICLASILYATSVDEIVKLSKLRTSDKLILQTLKKSPLDKSLSAKEIVYLKEQGVSEGVISYLIAQTDQSEKKTVEKSDRWRVYYKTDKNGKRVKVVTNLDENGHRMGGELPPQQQAAESNYQNYEPPKEIYVTIRNEEQPKEQYPEEPMPAGGIPIYDTYYPSYYPMYPTPYYPRSRRCCRNSFFPRSTLPGQANWHFNAGYTPAPRTFPTRPPQQSVPGSSSGYRRVR